MKTRIYATPEVKGLKDAECRKVRLFEGHMYTTLCNITMSLSTKFPEHILWRTFFFASVFLCGHILWRTFLYLSDITVLNRSYYDTEKAVLLI